MFKSNPNHPSRPIQINHLPNFSKSNFPLCFPFFSFSLFLNFLIFSLSHFPSWDFSLVLFPLFFPFLKLILFSFSLFLISRFSFKYKGFKDFFNFTFHDFILIKSRMKPYEKRKIRVKTGKEKEQERFSSFSLSVLFSLF